MAPQQLDSARTAYSVSSSRLDAARKQAEAQQAAVALAQAAQRSGGDAAQHPAGSARAAARPPRRRREKADVRLGYTEIRAPSAGIVDVRAARVGEFVTAGQPIVTLVNPDSLWVRADVEETYIDRTSASATRSPMRLPSGDAPARAPSSTAPSMPASPPSATSAAPSATSGRSRSGCAWTTPTGGSPSG